MKIHDPEELRPLFKDDPYLLMAACMERENRKSEVKGGWFSFDGGKYLGPNYKEGQPIGVAGEKK